MHLLGYLAAVLIGISLGLVGSGGSILTVPVLVYLMGLSPVLATTSSLFIVGSSSLVGGFHAYTRKMVALPAVIAFGLPSIFSIFLTRHFLLPVLPEHFFTIGNLVVTKDLFLMVVFALLMLASSFSMMRNRNQKPTERKASNQSPVRVTVLGLIVGLVTGLLGAGGGFLIIPSLVLFLHLDMKTAIGTSLFIIGINSLLGFWFSLNQFQYPWSLLLSFTGLAIGGIFIGTRIARHIDGASLKKGFGWFILLMGLYIIVRELFFHS